MADSNHSNSIHSSLREKIIEHLFVGDVLKCLWGKKIYSIEVLKAEVDNGGYDVVIDCNNIIRHIQLKASYKGAKTNRQNVNMLLCEKPNGCVIWIQFDEGSLSLGPFLRFGKKAGQGPLNLDGKKVAKHTKGNAEGVKGERQNIRVLGKNDFEKLESIEDVVLYLFGV